MLHPKGTPMLILAQDGINLVGMVFFLFLAVAPFLWLTNVLTRIRRWNQLQQKAGVPRRRTRQEWKKIGAEFAGIGALFAIGAAPIGMFSRIFEFWDWLYPAGETAAMLGILSSALPAALSLLAALLCHIIGAFRSEE
jgi:hypothetical protein